MSYLENAKVVLRSFNNPLKELENLSLKDELERQFYDREAEQHLRSFDKKLYLYDENEKMPATHKYFYSLLRDVRDKKVLDICCGYGFTSVMLAKRGAQVTSIDISPKMIELTQKNARFNNVEKSIEAKVMSAQEMSLKDNSFDYIVGFGAIHHLSLELAGKEISRVLKRGGGAIFIEPRIPFKFLIFVRSALPVKCLESPGGSQMTDRDIKQLAGYFSESRVNYFIFLKKLARLPFLESFAEKLEALDVRFLKLCPWLKKFYWAFVLEFKK